MSYFFNFSYFSYIHSCNKVSFFRKKEETLNKKLRIPKKTILIFFYIYLLYRLSYYYYINLLYLLIYYSYLLNA